MTSPANRQLIEKILTAAYQRSTPITRVECRELLISMFKEHDVTCTQVKTWSQEDFDNIKLDGGHIVKEARERSSSERHTDALDDKKITPYTKADDNEVEDALKRLGYPDPKDAA